MVEPTSSSHAACVLDCGGCDAAFLVGEHGTRPYSRAISGIFRATAPRLPKAIEANSNLWKGIFKKIFFPLPKTRPHESENFNPIQPYSRQFKPIQDPPGGEGQE